MATALSPAEESARRALRGGAIVLLLGIGLVGVGYEQLGAVPVLAGLALTIFGIHVYGRLGPDDEAGPPPTRADVEALASGGRSDLWLGGLIAFAGLAVTLGSYVGAATEAERGWGSYLVCYGAIVGGLIRAGRGWARRKEAKRAAAKVEKRRRLGKSPAP